MNTAIEVDLGGNVNSTHVMGTHDDERHRRLGRLHPQRLPVDLLLPVHGQGRQDLHHRAAAPRTWTTASTRCRSIVTEHGVADLRGKDPHERAQLIIENCAHPDYRDQLRDYLRLTRAGHAPLSLSLGLAMHRAFMRHGDMRHIDWEEYR